MAFNGIKLKMRYAFYKYIKHDRIGFVRKLGVRVGNNCQILCNPLQAFGTEPWLIKLGNHVDVTYGVKFLTHEGGIWCARGVDNKYKNMDCFKPIIVGDNVMIGMDSIIMPGVKIGNNVIIGAHSVVNKDIPDGKVYAGIPAKEISTVDKFLNKLETAELFETKNMNSTQKRKVLKEIHPEWFE